MTKDIEVGILYNGDKLYRFEIDGLEKAVMYRIKSSNDDLRLFLDFFNVDSTDQIELLDRFVIHGLNTLINNKGISYIGKLESI